MAFFQSASDFFRGQAFFAKGKEIVKSVYNRVKARVLTSHTINEIKRIFKPILSPNIPLPVPVPNGLPDVISPSKWVRKPRVIFGSIEKIFRPRSYQIVSITTPESVGKLTFGVPPQYLMPKTLAGKQYLDDVEDLFRFFVIRDIGVIHLDEALLSKGYIYAFRFESQLSYFCKDVLGNILSKQLYCTQGTTFKYAITNQEFTMSFNNNYADTFLEQFNNIVSNVARQSVYLSGQSLTQSLGSLADLLSQIPIAGHVVAGIKDMSVKLAQLAQKASQSKPGLQSLFSNLNQGKRLVLPKIWQGSSFSNSYSLHTTLYALSDDENEIFYRLLLPFAILLALSTPIADKSSYFYTYPFVFQGEIEGLRSFEAGAITDIRFSFGGERSFFDIDKRYLAIDIEFTVVDVYDIMVTPTMQVSDVDLVPTTSKWFRYLKDYLKKS